MVTTDPWQTEVRTVFEINRGRLGFCCRFLQDAVDLDPDTLKGTLGRATTLRSGGILFAVDAYIRHDDRRVENPNAAWLGEEVIALDHGSAFAGVDRTGVGGADVAGQTVLHAAPSFREHIFYAALLRFGEAIDWNRIALRLADVSDQAIEQAASGWPDELNPWKAKIVAFLEARREYAVEVIDGASKLVQASRQVGKSDEAG